MSALNTRRADESPFIVVWSFAIIRRATCAAPGFDTWIPFRPMSGTRNPRTLDVELDGFHSSTPFGCKVKVPGTFLNDTEAYRALAIVSIVERTCTPQSPMNLGPSSSLQSLPLDWQCSRWWPGQILWSMCQITRASLMNLPIRVRLWDLVLDLSREILGLSASVSAKRELPVHGVHDYGKA